MAKKTRQQISREVDSMLDLGGRRPDPLTVTLQAVRRAPPGVRFGDKVFIYPLWERVRARTGMELPDFKKWLLEQNRGGKLTLARFDLTGAVDGALLRHSEIQDRGASFHTVLDPAGPGY